MGNDCHRVTNDRSKEFTHDVAVSRNLNSACFRFADSKGHHTIDQSELQTHNHEAVPKGKVSQTSIAYLKREEISFLKACASKNVTAIRYLLKQGANVNLLDEDRTSPLHVACRSGSLQVIEELLNWGANIDMADMAGWTPLHISAFYDRSLVCHMLLKKGANPYHKNRNGETPWDLVKDHHTEEIFFIHFDKIDLRNMTKSKNEKKHILTKITEEEPPTINSSRRDGGTHQFETKISPRTTQTNHLIKSLQSEDFMKYMEVSKQNKGYSQRDESELVPKEEEVVKENMDPNEYQNNVSIPKKHKYFLHYKRLRENLGKGYKDVGDLLKTLQSEDSQLEDSFRASLMPQSARNSQFQSSKKMGTRTHNQEEVCDDDGVIAPQDANETSAKKTPLGQQSIMRNIFTHKMNNFSVQSRNESLYNSNSKFDKGQSSYFPAQNQTSIFGIVSREQRGGSKFKQNGVWNLEDTIKVLGFKIDLRFQDSLLKMGIEIFNYDHLKGVSYLLALNLIKPTIRDISAFLFHEDSSVTLKKYPLEVTLFLTNPAIRESAEILDSYASLFNFGGLSLFEALRVYLARLVIINDPEKIDWLLRGFAKYYFKFSKRFGYSSKTVDNCLSQDSVHMLSYAMIMLSIELHYPQHPMSLTQIHQLRQEFFSNLAGVNDGEDFNKTFLDEIFESIKTSNIIKIVDQPILEKQKKLSLRTPKFSFRIFKKSNKRSGGSKDFLLHFNGPVGFMVQIKGNGLVEPKYIFVLSQIVLRQYKNAYIQVLPNNNNSNSSQIQIAKFYENGIIIKCKSKFEFNLINKEDYNKLESYVYSL